jgi:hypothetical protein
VPDLVAAATSLASPAPYGADGLDWFAGIGQDNVDDFRLYLEDPDAARAKTGQDREMLLAASASDLVQALESLLYPPTWPSWKALPSISRTPLTRVSRPAARDGGMTAVPSSARGGSGWPRSPFRFC